MSGVVLWSLLVAVVLLTHADAEDDDYDYPDPQPQLVTKPSEYRVKEGAQLVLPCQVRDLGLYSVVWKKGQRVISAGQTITAVHRRFRLVRGHDLQIDRVKVKDTGTFTCSVLTEKLIEIRHKVDVLYPPEVEVERTTVYTGQGYQAKLTCIVYADPPAEVIWKREGSAIDRRRHVPSGNKMGTRHMLTIANVQQDDFDTYTCEAVNSLGEKKGRMIVTGVADRVHITSPPIGSAPEAFDLAWEVESYSPIHEYKVAFRMRKFNTSVDVPSPWKEVIVPTTGSEPVNDILHHQKITLRYLRPATLYDLYIQASNRHGWNAVSDMFHFSTLARDEALESRVASRSGTSSRRLPVLVSLLLVLVWLGTGQLF